MPPRRNLAEFRRSRIDGPSLSCETGFVRCPESETEGPNREYGEDDPIGAETVAAPATVSGEVLMQFATGKPGRPHQNHRPASQETCRTNGRIRLNGLTEGDMTTKTISTSFTISQRATAGIISLFMGCSMVFMVGLSHISAVHNAAHDTRHAIGFPCH